MDAKVYRFFAATISGLEEVVADELSDRLPEVNGVHLEKGRRQGRVFFTHRRSPRQLVELQTPLSVAGVLAQIQGITVGRPGLERLLAQLQRVELRGAQALMKACDPDADPTRFQLSVTLQGAHRFTKSEVVRAVQTQLRSRGLEPGEGPGRLRLLLHVEGGRALLGVQVGPNRADECFGDGGVGGPLASCLGRLLPAAGEEPLLALGFNAQGAGLLAKGEQRGEVVCLEPGRRVARKGVGPVLAGEACDLPFAGGSYAVVVDAGFAEPYLRRLRELARVVLPGGVVALLAGESPHLAALLSAAGEFAILAALPINLKGRAQGLWILERLEATPPLLQIELGGAGG